MRAVLQRVARAEVRVDGQVVGAIGRGLVVLLGVGMADDERTADAFARRVVDLRIHRDVEGRTNLDLPTIGGAVLAVSQLTLYADTRRGRRPGFTAAAPPEVAARLYDRFCRAVAALGVPVARGMFGAAMEVELVNEGQMTIWLDSEDRPA